jgi:ubiquilin
MITITIKCSNAEKAEVETEPSATVAEFKVLVGEKLSVPAENQRLIYKGRILKDESTLEQYDIEGMENIKVHTNY